jgi:hypothetical protein
MTWSERVAPGVAIMRARGDLLDTQGHNAFAYEINSAAYTLERMAEELDNARQTIIAFSIFGIVLALSAFAYAWRVG